jgi:hypothetical protein
MVFLLLKRLFGAEAVSKLNFAFVNFRNHYIRNLYSGFWNGSQSWDLLHHVAVCDIDRDVTTALL